jgi:NADPH-dependent curcumin reductase CurA
MAERINRRWVLAERPAGAFDESAFRLEEVPIPEPGPGEMLVHNIWLSVDPYMRGRMRQARSYAKPVEIGAVMEGGTVGEVIASNNPKFKAGEIIEQRLGWQDYGISDGAAARKIDPSLAPIQTAVGVLGMPGMTAYFGAREVMGVEKGDTIVVSAASGAVGGLVGQVARISGAARVIGIAGGAEKCAYCVNDLGYDVCLDYHAYKGDSAALAAAILEAALDRVNGYFDNVGGWISDAVYSTMAFFGRIAICGTISEYNDEKPELAPRIYRHILVNRLTMRGLIVFDFKDRFAEGEKAMAGWIKNGRLKYREDVVEGLENAPKAMMRLFKSQNFGKQLVKIRDWNGA